jgi:hypothetical protein
MAFMNLMELLIVKVKLELTIFGSIQRSFFEKVHININGQHLLKLKSFVKINLVSWNIL